MEYLSQILFALVVGVAVFFFVNNKKKLIIVLTLGLLFSNCNQVKETEVQINNFTFVFPDDDITVSNEFGEYSFRKRILKGKTEIGDLSYYCYDLIHDTAMIHISGEIYTIDKAVYSSIIQSKGIEDYRLSVFHIKELPSPNALFVFFQKDTSNRIDCELVSAFYDTKGEYGKEYRNMAILIDNFQFYSLDELVKIFENPTFIDTAYSHCCSPFEFDEPDVEWFNIDTVLLDQLYP